MNESRRRKVRELRREMSDVEERYARTWSEEKTRGEERVYEHGRHDTLTEWKNWERKILSRIKELTNKIKTAKLALEENDRRVPKLEGDLVRTESALVDARRYRTDLKGKV